jgi:hypothetical protein
MPKVLDFADGFYIECYQFGQAQVAASQTAVAIPIHGAKATDGSSLVTSFTMPWAGSIIGITADVSAASSAGTGSVAATLDGTAVTGGSLTVTALTSARTTLDGQSTGRFAAGAVLGVKITTNGSWNATTSDIAVTIYVLFEGVQP